MSAAGRWWLQLAFKLLLAFLVFAVEVRVHARTEDPERCWAADGACAIRSGETEKLYLSLDGGELVLDEASTLVRIAKNQLRILAGTAWLRLERAVTVTCEFGEFALPQGEFWISRTRDRVNVSAVSGTAVMRPRGGSSEASEELEVPAGLENWMGRVRAGTGKAQTGVPMPIPLKPHLQRWARLFRGGRDQFGARAEAFYEVWSQAARASADLHRTLAERKLAAVDAERTREAEASRKVEARNRELIEMFRRRVLDP